VAHDVRPARPYCRFSGYPYQEITMHYIILTEPSKSSENPFNRNDIYWSRAFGSFSRRDQATYFESFEAAQPKVRELRKFNPFVHAVEVS
jgi:hypothetical protein